MVFLPSSTVSIPGIQCRGSPCSQTHPILKTNRSQNQVDTWPLPQSGRWSLSLMVLTKAKFRQSLCAYREAVCRGNNNQGHLLCAVGMFFSSSFSQRKSSIRNATAQHWQEHFSFHVLLLHAVALKCQIVIRSLLF